MKAEFWQERWKQNQLGFHQSEANTHLEKYWPDLGLEPAACVFVPLCGKSLDMHWLHGQGHPVVGVELSPIAVHDFFTEAGLTPTREEVDSLVKWTSEGYTLYCGDLFDLGAEALGSVRACYDRGSLVALPPDLRQRYAEHLVRVLPERVTILMLTIEYDQSQMQGPPHSVPATEVESLFGNEFSIETLWLSEWLAAPPHFRARGLEAHRDRVLRLDRGGHA